MGDILVAAARISDYTRGVTIGHFFSNNEKRDAVIRQVGIVGEAASKLSHIFRAAHPSVPWSQIIGMRNIVIHQYWEVDLDVVWEIATQDIPVLVKELKPPSVPPVMRSRPLRRRF